MTNADLMEILTIADQIEGAGYWYDIVEICTAAETKCECRDAFGRHLPECPVGAAIVADGMKETKCEHWMPLPSAPKTKGDDNDKG